MSVGRLMRRGRPFGQEGGSRVLAVHREPVAEVAFDPSGARLATVSLDGTARLWDVTTGRSVWRVALDVRLGWTVAFSGDGTALATAGGYHGSVQLWDPATGEHLRTLTGHRRAIGSVAFSPDGSTLAAAGNDGTVRLWPLRAGSPVSAADSAGPARRSPAPGNART